MNTSFLKNYQEKAVSALVEKSVAVLAKTSDASLEDRTIILKAPTGSGKTFMIANFIYQLIQLFEKRPNEEVCFLWMSIGKGELHMQSYHALKKVFGTFPFVSLLENAFSGGRRVINPDEVVVANWEKLRAKDAETGEWKNVLMKDKETTNFRELIVNTKNLHQKIVLIIDESHSNARGDRAQELREIIDADRVIEVSATPTLIDGKHDSRLVEVASFEVIEEGMIKKEIIINDDIDKLTDDEMTSQNMVLEMAYQKRQLLQKAYGEEDSAVHPLVLVQIPNGGEGEQKRKAIELFLASKDITLENGKLAVWLSEEKVNLEILENNLSDVEFLIFKQAIDTGWDCPRAQILVKFRESNSETFELQTLGRILRMPEAMHYDNDFLNKAFVYTNIEQPSFNGKDQSVLNVIKSLKVSRNDAVYGNLFLRSYYCNRIDYGDLRFSFQKILAQVLCERFGIDQSPPQSKERMNQNYEKARKVIDFDCVKKENLILNKHVATQKFDEFYGEKIIASEKLQAFTGQDDITNQLKSNLKVFLQENGFAPVRSFDILQGGLLSWFRHYLGLDASQSGMLPFLEKVLVIHEEFFGVVLKDAFTLYRPIKKKEMQQKIEDTEQWKDSWEIAPSRKYNPETHQEFDYALALYKNDHNKTYLQFDSKIEKKFVDFLDKHSQKIVWWWQNGNEHMQANFGIKYGQGSTFQPDFLVKFSDGRIGIFDTKASGFNEADNKVKAEALQRYIAEENEKRQEAFLWGGLVIEDGSYFRINSDKEYVPFDEIRSVKEPSTTYEGRAHTGWRLFEL